MSDTPWTKGPWEVRRRLNSIGQPNENGRFVILWAGHSKREDFFIAEMPFVAARYGDIAAHEANARLIAAAPLMAEVLMDWEKTPGSQRTGDWWDRWNAKLKAALSAARGEQQ